MLFDNQKLFLSYMLHERNEKIKALKNRKEKSRVVQKKLRLVHQLDF